MIAGSLSSSCPNLDYKSPHTIVPNLPGTLQLMFLPNANSRDDLDLKDRKGGLPLDDGSQRKEGRRVTGVSDVLNVSLLIACLAVRLATTFQVDLRLIALPHARYVRTLSKILIIETISNKKRRVHADDTVGRSSSFGEFVR